MRKAIIAAAAACMVTAAAPTRADTEPIELRAHRDVRRHGNGAVKAVIEAYDWVLATLVSAAAAVQGGRLWHCSRLRVPAGRRGRDACWMTSAAKAFIERSAPASLWYAGQGAQCIATTCKCFLFRYDGEQWFASGPSFKNLERRVLQHTPQRRCQRRPRAWPRAAAKPAPLRAALVNCVGAQVVYNLARSRSAQARDRHPRAGRHVRWWRVAWGAAGGLAAAAAAAGATRRPLGR